MSTSQAVVCSVCHSPVPEGSAFCTRCGTVLDTVRVITPVHGSDQQWGGRRRGSGSGRPGAAAGDVDPAGGWRLPAAATGAGGARRTTADEQLAARRGRAAALGPAFDGVAPASTGRRLAAFTVDAVLAWGLGGLLAWLVSPVLGAVVVLEVVVAQVLWEARTGRTAGNVLLGLRTAQQEAPWGPGLGRASGRALLLGLAHLVVVGPWLVVASAGSDARGRAWHDRAASTVVVDVRAMRVEPADDDVAAPVVHGPAPVPVPEPVPEPVREPQHATGRLPETGQVPVVGPSPVAGSPTTPPPVPRVPDPPAAPEGPVVAASAVAPEPGPATYVVTLDTGEAMSVTGPGYVGRRPQPPAGEPCDHVIAIDDPGRSLSRTHARFGVDGSGFWVEDLGSANGTAVVAPDGTRFELPLGERVVVPDGGTVRLGERTFVVQRYF